jgi:hypothetical protein
MESLKMLPNYYIEILLAPTVLSSLVKQIEKEDPKHEETPNTFGRVLPGAVFLVPSSAELVLWTVQIIWGCVRDGQFVSGTGCRNSADVSSSCRRLGEDD